MTMVWWQWVMVCWLGFDALVVCLMWARGHAREKAAAYWAQVDADAAAWERNARAGR